MHAGSDVLGPFPLSFVEQFAFGFFDTVILGTLPANALGTADFPLVVPDAPSLRGIDVSVAPW